MLPSSLRVARRRALKESGFTLIELLVVILIIGVLASIAVPMFLNQRKEAATATLKSDMRNAAMEYTTWYNSHGYDNTSARAAMTRLTMEFDQSGITLPKNVPGLPDFKVSEGNKLEVLVISPSGTTDLWDTPHLDGEFCVSGNADGSSYDYPGNNAALYHQKLYYDQQLGGIATMDDIYAKWSEGERTSCYRFAKSWAERNGL